MTDHPVRCRHCGSNIYQSRVTGTWLHHGNLDTRCKTADRKGYTAEPVIEEPERGIEDRWWE